MLPFDATRVPSRYSRATQHFADACSTWTRANGINIWTCLSIIHVHVTRELRVAVRCTPEMSREWLEVLSSFHNISFFGTMSSVSRICLREPTIVDGIFVLCWLDCPRLHQFNRESETKHSQYLLFWHNVIYSAYLSTRASHSRWRLFCCVDWTAVNLGVEVRIFRSTAVYSMFRMRSCSDIHNACFSPGTDRPIVTGFDEVHATSEHTRLPTFLRDEPKPWAQCCLSSILETGACALVCSYCIDTRTSIHACGQRKT